MITRVGMRQGHEPARGEHVRMITRGVRGRWVRVGGA